MEFQRNSFFCLLCCTSAPLLGADCSTLPRDAAFAPATVKAERTFLELGSFPATPFPKSTPYWPANGVLTEPLVITAIWKPANSPKKGSPVEEPLPAPWWLWLLCVSQKSDPVLTHGFYNPVTAPAPLALVHVPRSLNEKRRSLIPYSQTLLNPRVLGSSWTV